MPGFCDKELWNEGCPDDPDYVTESNHSSKSPENQSAEKLVNSNSSITVSVEVSSAPSLNPFSGNKKIDLAKHFEQYRKSRHSDRQSVVKDDEIITLSDTPEESETPVLAKDTHSVKSSPLFPNKTTSKPPSTSKDSKSFLEYFRKDGPLKRSKPTVSLNNNLKTSVKKPKIDPVKKNPTNLLSISKKGGQAKNNPAQSRCKFNDDWLNVIDINGMKIGDWTTQYTATETYCDFCHCVISIASKGVQALTQHADTKKHSSLAHVRTDQKQSSFLPSNDDLSLHSYSQTDLARRAEVIWTLKMSTSDFSARSCDGIGDLFKFMFPKGIGVPEDFSLARTKAGYVTAEAVAPHFREIMLKDVKNKFFTITYDETTNNNGKKEKEQKVLIRFWSDKEFKAVTRHLESFFIRSATGDILYDNIMKALENGNLPVAKVLMLGSDGPNVNKNVFNRMQKTVKDEREKGLVDIGSCNLHIINNSFRKGLECLGMNAEDFLISVFYFFNGWPVRLEDYESIQTKFDLPHHYFIKHVSSRWLTIETSASRILEQFKGLSYYFLQFIPKEKTDLQSAKHYVKICNFLKKKTAKAELEFVVASASIFTEFCRLFQREKSLIHCLYDEIKNLILKLANRVCKDEVILNFSKIDLNEPFKPENIKSVESFESSLSGPVKTALEKVSESDKLFFLNAAKAHFIAAGKHIISKCPLVGKHLKSFGFLKATNMIHWSSKNIIQVAKLLPFDVDISQLRDEYSILQTDLKSKNEKTLTKMSTSEFWTSIFNEVNNFGNPKYPIITKVAQASFSLSHGNADAERQFSLSKHILTEDKTQISCQMLNARLAVKDAIEHNGGSITNVPISKELIKSAGNAHRRYQERLHAEKDKKKEKDAKDAAEMLKNQQEIEQLEKVSKAREELDALEKELTAAEKTEKDGEQVAERMLKEGNQRLKEAIKSKNMVELELSQAMIESADKLLEEAKTKQKATNALRQKVNKRKNAIVNTYCARNPKKSKK